MVSQLDKSNVWPKQKINSILLKFVKMCICFLLVALSNDLNCLFFQYNNKDYPTNFQLHLQSEYSDNNMSIWSMLQSSDMSESVDKNEQFLSKKDRTRGRIYNINSYIPIKTLSTLEKKNWVRFINIWNLESERVRTIPRCDYSSLDCFNMS